jgi:hypothetical protein
MGGMSVSSIHSFNSFQFGVQRRIFIFLNSRTSEEGLFTVTASFRLKASKAVTKASRARNRRRDFMTVGLSTKSYNYFEIHLSAPGSTVLFTFNL